MTRGGYYHLRRAVPVYAIKFKKRKYLKKITRRLKRINWQVCYLKKNKQTQWRRGYNNSRVPLLLEKLWYPMRKGYVKFRNTTNYQNEPVIYTLNQQSYNIIPDIWEDHIDLNDIIKKV